MSFRSADLTLHLDPHSVLNPSHSDYSVECVLGLV